MSKKISRRQAIQAGAFGGVGAWSVLTGCEKAPQQDESIQRSGEKQSHADEEYVWLSANSNLPLFTAHDHPALRLAGEELGVKVSLAGPNSVDIPGLVAAI